MEEETRSIVDWFGVLNRDRVVTEPLLNRLQVIDRDREVSSTRSNVGIVFYEEMKLAIAEIKPGDTLRAE